MKSSMATADEAARLLELYQYNILDSPYEEDFNDIVHLANSICETPISTITFIDKDRQWFKAHDGVNKREDKREISFCAHAVAGSEEFFEIKDATKDERFLDNPLVLGDPNIRFYAGVTLISPKGFKLGTLCVIDTKPNQLNEKQSYALKILAKQVMKLTEQNLQNQYLQEYRRILLQRTELQDRVISIIAHDVRSPMASLKNVLDLSEQDIISPADKTKMLGMCGGLVEETLKLLDNLVDWGKAQLGTSIVEHVVFNLSETVDDVLRNFEVAASVKGIELVNGVDSGLMISSDANILSFVIRNLVSNALKFTEEGSIRVTAKRNNNNLIISIIDTAKASTT